MKILCYSVDDLELEYFKKYKNDYELEYECLKECITVETAKLAKGFDAVNIKGIDTVDESIINVLADLGIKFVVTRSIGYNHIDKEACVKRGIRISNITYSPYSVADFTVMLMLMTNRKVEQNIANISKNNYAMNGLIGREMHNLTVGIVGTGAIGEAVINNLQGFGCKIIAYDLFKKERLKGLCTYVEMEDIYRNSDIISLHVPSLPSTVHMINKANLAMMKPEAVVINCARGDLIKTEDLIEALKNKKISGAALDVLEGEAGVYHENLEGKEVDFANMQSLKKMQNVILTSHLAYYTTQAVDDMVNNSLLSLTCFSEGTENKFEK